MSLARRFPLGFPELLHDSRGMISKILLVILPLTSTFAYANTDGSVHKIRVSKDIAAQTEFEPSGLIYLAKQNKYLVVSDDTDREKTPLLFVMSDDGDVSSTLTIPGLDTMTDMESISRDGEDIYVMSSLVPSKSGKYKESQNLLVRFELNGMQIRNVVSVNFGDLLRSALESSSDPALKDLIIEGIDELEVEGHAVKNKVLFVAIKGPVLAGGQSVVLKITNLEFVLANEQKPKLQVFAIIDFKSLGRNNQKISDITFVNEDMYLTTAHAGKRAGGVWKLASGASKPQLLKYYEHAQPEGIALNSSIQNLMMTFDQGKEAGLFSKLKP